MDQISKRLLMELEKAIRDINRSVINPVIPELTVAGINPVMTLVARTRAEYLKALFDLTDATGKALPDKAQIESLRQLRETYEEMLAGAQALEAAIQRGYLDVQGRQA